MFTFEGGYHGRTLGASSITSSYRYRRRFGHFGDRAQFIPFPYPFRRPKGMTAEEYSDQIVREFERKFENEYHAIWNPKTRQCEYAAFYVEPIQGTGGYVVPPANFFKGLKKVLDEHGILCAYLERDGLRARTAADGREALRLMQQLRPDLVLLDIHLPEVDGIDVLRAIRDGGQTPVIMVTALADDVDKLLALHLGADDYVVKPFNPPEVVAHVRAVLRRTQMRLDSASAPIRVGAIEIDAQATAPSATTRPATPSRCRSR